MVGANLTSAGNHATYENLRISRVGGAWTYWGSPMGRSPLPFTLTEAGPQRAVFENADHDFPRRILYWRDGENLVARIEGTLKSKPAAMQWRFSRGTAESCPAVP